MSSRPLAESIEPVMWTGILIGAASGALILWVSWLVRGTTAQSKARTQAIADGTPYCQIPAALQISDRATYVQPWSGYSPQDQLQGKEPSQDRACRRANIKPPGEYDKIEVGENAWVRMACDEARRAVEVGGGPFGAVLLQIDDDTNEAIRYWRTHNRVTLANDASAHAEVLAIRAACQELGVFDLGRIAKVATRLPQRGATSHCEIYSSSEPCPMCFAAIAWARISVLVFAATRHDAAVPGVGFSDAAIYAELAKPYHERAMQVYQATTDISLDAFNLWKRSPKTPY